MLGFGWTEMLVIGVIALIVIGPKDLPAVMHRVGKFAGSIRRMGSEFQRELNKTTGLNEIRNLRSSITQPLKSTTDAIRKEFNTTAADGTVKPSGAIKPTDPNKESVVDEIKAAAGMSAKTDGPQMEPKSGPVKAALPAKTGATGKSEGGATASPASKKVATRKAPAKSGASKTPASKTAKSKAAASKSAAAGGTAATVAAAKPALAKRSAGSAAGASDAVKAAPAKPRTRKAAPTAAESAATSETKPAARKARAPKATQTDDTPVAAAPRKRSPAKKA